MSVQMYRDEEIDYIPVHRLFTSLNNINIFTDPNAIFQVLDTISRAPVEDQTYLARSATAHLFTNYLDAISEDLEYRILVYRLEVLFEYISTHDYQTEICTGVRAAITGIMADRKFLADNGAREDYGLVTMDFDQAQVQQHTADFQAKMTSYPDAIKISLLNGGLGFAKLMDVRKFYSIPASATTGLETGIPQLNNAALEPIRQKLAANPDAEIFLMDDVIDTASTMLAAFVAVLMLKLSVNYDPQIADELRSMIDRVQAILTNLKQYGDINDQDFNYLHAVEIHALLEDLVQAPFRIHVAVLTDKLLGQSSIGIQNGQVPSYDIIYPSFVEDENGERIDPKERPWLMGFSTLDTGVQVKVFDSTSQEMEEFKVSIGRSLQQPLVLQGNTIPGKYTNYPPFVRMQILVWNVLVDLGIEPANIQLVGLKRGHFPGGMGKES